MNAEILRIVDAIHRDRAIDKEVLFTSIEQGLSMAVKKSLNLENSPTVTIDRENGTITAYDGEKPIAPADLGRIAAQAAKQIIMQKISEAERDTVFIVFEAKKNDIVTAHISRYEGPHLVCTVDKTESILLKGEQVPGESFRIGERIRVMVLSVEKKGTKAKIYLTRAHKDFVRRLFEMEVPELTNGTILVKGISRDPGYRTKIVVTSTNPKVDCVGACVGVRGARIRNIVDELNGENIDIVRWSDEPAELVKNALKPAEIADIQLDAEKKRALVHVHKDHLSQAIGKGGRNVRLASQLTGWEIDIREVPGQEAAPAAGSEAPSVTDEAVPEDAPPAEAEPAGPEEPKEQGPTDTHGVESEKEQT